MTVNSGDGCVFFHRVGLSSKITVAHVQAFKALDFSVCWRFTRRARFGLFCSTADRSSWRRGHSTDGCVIRIFALCRGHICILICALRRIAPHPAITTNANAKVNLMLFRPCALLERYVSMILKVAKSSQRPASANLMRVNLSIGASRRTKPYLGLSGWMFVVLSDLV